MEEAMERDPNVIKLQKPIEWGETVIKEIRLSEPKGKHLRLLPAEPGFSDLINLAAKLANQPKSVFDEMSSKDVSIIVDRVGELL